MSHVGRVYDCRCRIGVCINVWGLCRMWNFSGHILPWGLQKGGLYIERKGRSLAPEECSVM